MKIKNIFFVVLALTLFCITGCATAAPYSFAENEIGNGTAAITFKGNNVKGVDLHYFENVELPIPKGKRTFFGRTGKYWAPVTFPAGRPFKLTVSVYHDVYDSGIEEIFNCPALNADSNYTLEVKIEKGRSFLGIQISEGSERLILKNAKTKAIVYEQ